MEQEKIILHINYNEPIELLNFSSGLVCFQRLYTNITKLNDENSKIVIKEVKQGSIIIDFLVQCQPYFQQFKNIKNSVFFIEKFNVICEFIKNIKSKPKEEIKEIIKKK